MKPAKPVSPANSPTYVLCLSRSYLSRLLPTMGQHHPEAVYHHIVQTDREAASVEKAGGTVVLNLEAVVRLALADRQGPVWQEPSDWRALTGFEWCPIQSDRYLPHFSPAVRVRIAGALQKAVGDLFERQRYSGFLSEPVALFITHLVFYHCRRSGTQPLLWCNTYHPGDFYFADGTEISVPLRRKPRTAEEKAGLATVIETYVNGVVGDRAGPVYHHAFSGNKAKRLGYFDQRRGEAPLILRPGWTSRLIQLARLMRALGARAIFPWGSDYITAASVAEHRFYLRCLFARSNIYDPLPDIFSEVNVVFPLQYEPEASLLYFAPHIVSQSSFVETVLRALPADKLLWVKEHPNQFGALGDRVWRNLKKRYANLRFVHGRQSGRELIKRSALVVTITSTMGLDGLLLGRKVLVSGKVFYAEFTGAIKVLGYPELARELNNEVNYVLSDNILENISELVDFGCNSYPGDPQPSACLFDEDNLKKLRDAIDFELKDKRG